MQFCMLFFGRMEAKGNCCSDFLTFYEKVSSEMAKGLNLNAISENYLPHCAAAQRWPITH